MTSPLEPSESVVQAQAFGINLVLPDDLDLRGLSPPDDDLGAPTAVRNDPTGPRDRWSGAQPKRTREVRYEELLMLSVDHDPARGYLLQAPGIGAALISSDGLEVCCAPEPDTTEWKSLLVGQVLPLAATVRGLEVFHAAGVARGCRTYMLCAAQGVGKTSLAAHLVLAGAQLLSDDVVAVDDRLIAYPGGGILHLRNPELEALGSRPLPGLRRLGTARGRTTFAADHLSRAHRLGGIYLLERAGGGAAIEPVAHPSPFSVLGATFNLSVQTDTRLIHHLELCIRIAESVPIFRVRIVPGRLAGELASALAAHIDDRETAQV